MAASLVVRFILATLRFAPFRVALALAGLYVRILRFAAPKLDRVARRNFEIAGMPDLLDGVWRTVARNLAVFARFPSIGRHNIARWIRYEGFEHFAAAKQRGKGVLFATAHLGNWELSAFAHALLAEPMDVVVRPLDNPGVDALVERRRMLSGNRIIGKRNAARAILGALRENRAVGILVDQNVVEREGVFVPFFGVPACAGSGFAKIAWRSGAVVLPGFALWSERERRYVLRFFPPVELCGDAAEDTRRVQAAVESAVREYPDQWLWIHRRWKTRPSGEAPLYTN